MNSWLILIVGRWKYLVSCFLIARNKNTFLTLQLNFKDLVGSWDHVRLERREDKLRTWNHLSTCFILCSMRHFLDHFGYTLTISFIQGTVKLVKDVEWRHVDFLDGKNETSCNDSFLTSWKIGQRLHFFLAVFLATFFND